MAGGKTLTNMKVFLKSTAATICDAIDRVYASPNPQVESFFHDLRVAPDAFSVPPGVVALGHGEFSEEALFLYTPVKELSGTPPAADLAPRISIKT